MSENDVTPSYVIEMKRHQTIQNDVTVVRAVICCRIYPVSFQLPVEARCVTTVIKM